MREDLPRQLLRLRKLRQQLLDLRANIVNASKRSHSDQQRLWASLHKACEDNRKETVERRKALIDDTHQRVSNALRDLFAKIHYPFEEAVDPKTYQKQIRQIGLLLKCSGLLNNRDLSVDRSSILDCSEDELFVVMHIFNRRNWEDFFLPVVNLTVWIGDQEI
ncbi:unnamed protein product [Gongylonema pulchrum]|uniref:Centromere protein K n=1 Tax=Gongylonema pulchrum TaxID=637853 RepID=A0A183EL58_9BILA|nr:unnamed protein product [Gongylonema pulchrum]